MVASPAARPVVRGIVVGIMVALPGREHHDYPTTHAHTPSRLLTTAIREGFGLDHPRIVLATTTTITTTTAAAAATTATGFCCRRWKLAAVLPELIAVRSVPHFWDTSNQEMHQRLDSVPCNCAPIVSIVYTLHNLSFI